MITLRISGASIEGAPQDLVAIEVEVDEARLLRSRPGALMPLRVMAIERRTVERA